MSALEIIQLIATILSSIGLLGAALLFMIKPNFKQDTSIALLEDQLNKLQEAHYMLLKTQQNDIHTLTGQIDKLQTVVNDVCINQARLEERVDERMPRQPKQNSC